MQGILNLYEEKIIVGGFYRGHVLVFEQMEAEMELMTKFTNSQERFRSLQGPVLKEISFEYLKIQLALAHYYLNEKTINVMNGTIEDWYDSENLFVKCVLHPTVCEMEKADVLLKLGVGSDFLMGKVLITKDTKIQIF